jgi:RNA polymerase sigma-70 factor (ECF subfamily)
MRGKRGRREWDAFDEFCRREYPRLVGSIGLIVGNIDVAADAVSEALARAWNRHQRGEDPEVLGAWIRVVALNIARSQHRHRLVEERHLPRLLPTVRANTDHEGWGLSVDVKNALANLPRRQREVAVLHFILDLSVDRIAEDLGLAPSTVKTSLQRARARLNAALQDRAGEVLNDAS